MESENPPPSNSLVKCCDCGCSRSMMKRSLSGSYISSNADIRKQCVDLRETVISQQQTIQDLVANLEEEQNASCSAIDEAMSMILRLQKEKAETEMEAVQFKRFAEEKMDHDQQKILELEDLLYNKEQSIQSLTFEVQAYKHRKMMSFRSDCSDAEIKASGDSGMVQADKNGMISYGLTNADTCGDQGMSQKPIIADNLDNQLQEVRYEMYMGFTILVMEIVKYFSN